MFYKGQIGFIGIYLIDKCLDNLAAPLWKAINLIYPKLNELIKNMENNI